MNSIIKLEHSYLNNNHQLNHDHLTLSKRRPRHRLSCAECRRLKLKCDRTWPCSSCTKRGCARICPEGTLQAKIRSKDTSILLAKIAELESLLQQKDRDSRPQNNQIIHDQNHPNIIPTDFTPSIPFSNQVQDPTLLALIDGIGTLNLSGDGRSRFLGLSASSAFLDGDWSDTESLSSTPGTSEGPDDSLDFSSPLKFHFGLTRRPIDPNHLKSLLPERREAERLGNIPFGYVFHVYGILSPSEFTLLLDEVYSDKRNEICMTRLALLYATFSLGVLFDPAIQALHPDARKWHDAAESCLMSTHYFSNPTLAAVQAIHVMGLYLLNSRPDATEMYWPVLGTAMRLCQSMGLHRDGSNWGLELTELDVRRRTFHELLSLDRMQSLLLGRPYAISDKHHDTFIPHSSTLKDEKSGGSNNTFATFKWQFSSCIGHVIDDAFSISSPSLAIINRLDEELRQFDVKLSSELKCPNIPSLSNGPSWNDTPQTNNVFGMTGPINLRLTMQQHFMALLENTTLLFLHRRAFALALSDSVAEPLNSSFSKSVVAVIVESSRNLIMVAHSAQSSYPELANRFWYLFFHAYSGATCVATLLIKSPGCMLAKNAWSTLSIALSVFRTAAPHGPLCRDLLIRLNRLHKQAMKNLGTYASGDIISNQRRLSFNSFNQNQTLRSLGPNNQDEVSTPLANFLQSTKFSSHGTRDDLPCELGASTRLTRKNRTPSMSNSSATSGQGPSLSSPSRSRGTSFGSSSPNDAPRVTINIGTVGGLSQANSHGINHNVVHNNSNKNNGPNSTLATSFNNFSWNGLGNSPGDEFDEEEGNEPPCWENLSVEPAEEPFNNQIFNVPHAQSTNYFEGFSEHFHPPMVLPSSEVLMSSTGSNFGSVYGPAPNPHSFENSPGLTAVSSPLVPLSGNLNSHDNHNATEVITSPTNTQFDLLDTFLTWSN
ncbi:hypothetical protein O181_047398 [Austropuccinia psidii MF-1]|uniref:Zn(2)-C6 fungal-type domain-containing protein n=1 Tax=Austropuccinia psidii MF-1 TaxID=1389203 RepID=A0A9Q3HJG5_9BASI|nr:hypothetical protein [Austropuccinia psidii MF-1]